MHCVTFHCTNLSLVIKTFKLYWCLNLFIKNKCWNQVFDASTSAKARSTHIVSSFFTLLGTLLAKLGPVFTDAVCMTQSKIDKLFLMNGEWNRTKRPRHLDHFSLFHLCEMQATTFFHSFNSQAGWIRSRVKKRSQWMSFQRAIKKIKIIQIFYVLKNSRNIKDYSQPRSYVCFLRQ